MRKTLLALLLLPAVALAQPGASAAISPFPWLCSGAQWCDRVIAVVDTQPVLLSEALGELQIQATRSNRRLPTDSAGLTNALLEVVQAIVDAKVIIHAAIQAAVEIDETQILAKTDAQMQGIRRQFTTDSIMRAEIRASGYASIEAFRAQLMEQARDSARQFGYMRKMRDEGKIPSVQVTEAEIAAEFERIRNRLPPKLGGYAFRQIVLPVRASPAARLAARNKADSLRRLIVGGADFGELAKKESMDPSTREGGGLLPPFARGAGLVPEFERWVFTILPGQITPVFETQFGYHIARVEKATPSKVTSRHILIRAKTDSIDLANTRALGDTLTRALRAGAKFDSLVARHHHPDETASFPNPIPLDTLLVEYAAVMKDMKPGDVSEPFVVPDRTGEPTVRIVIVTKIEQPRENTVDDWRQFARDQVVSRKQTEKLVERLRKQIYTRVLL